MTNWPPYRPHCKPPCGVIASMLPSSAPTYRTPSEPIAGDDLT